MDVVGLGLSIPGAIDLGIKYGTELRRLYSAIQNAEAEIDEYMLRIENGRIRIKKQHDVLCRVDKVLTAEHRDVYVRTLRATLGKLVAVNDMVVGLVKIRLNPDGNGVLAAARLKYAVKKRSLDRAMDEFETWQRAADPSWFLIMKISDSRIDDALHYDTTASAVTIRANTHAGPGLRQYANDPGTSSPRKPLSLEPQELTKMDISKLAMCHASCATRADSAGLISTFILDWVDAGPRPANDVLKAKMRDLALRLQHKDHPDRFGLLACKGFVAQVPKSALVFKTPPNQSNPRSLRDLLIKEPAPESLTCHFDIAKALAKGVSFVHIFGFVHKNINPESIISFDNRTASPSIYLVGFDHFRTDMGHSDAYPGQMTLEREIYRHPARQGCNPEARYSMQHDIYSLGVCLLEIGLWRTLVEYVENNGSNTRPSDDLSVPGDVDVFVYLKSSAKDHFVSLARKQLPRIMGTQYAQVVETCLTCLDPGNDDFGDEREFEDQDGILVGARYIEKVLLRLNMIYI